MALRDVEQETCQPDEQKDVMAEVIDAMFRYGTSSLYKEQRAIAKKNMVWNKDKEEQKGTWKGRDVHFMFRLKERCFYVSGTTHYYEIDDEVKNDKWGWMDGLNWSCNISWCDDEMWKEQKKCLKKWGETPFRTYPDNLDHPNSCNLMDFYKKDRKKIEATKYEIAKRKANRPSKNPFNFKFWEWMG